MNIWAENAVNNILPLSKSNDLKNSLREWHYTWGSY